MKTYSPRTLTLEQAAKCVVDLLYTFNLADSQIGAAWTTPNMSSQRDAYGVARKLLDRIGGKAVWDKWIESGDLDLELLVSPSGKKPKGRKSLFDLPGLPLKDNPGHGKKRKPKSSSSRPGYRVCARTTSGGWANKGTDLSGPEADRLMAKLKREGFEVAKFKGRKRVK
jgi:hypothetical protein